MSDHTFHHGSQVTDDGVVFNLWAPSAQRVELIVGKKEPVKMYEVEKGCYQFFEKDARAGTLYNFLIDGEHRVPDPASLFQPFDVADQSEVTDLSTLPPGPNFKGRPWAEAVIYELHVGTFSPEGTYAGVASKLDYLKHLGVTAIELMPLNDVPGARNWGYDGVLLNAPNAIYGRPEELKQLINAAHERGIMVYLDVVYNHFGPSENHISSYAKQFFNENHTTGWGPAVNLEGQDGARVRQFLTDNALRWVNDYGFDGLRFDAVHALKDDSERHFLYELAETIRASAPGRHIHLMLENEYNQARYLNREDNQALSYNAQWGDDFHNSLHVILTGEKEGYYRAFADKPLEHLARSLTECFAYQGEKFPLTGRARGEPSAHLPPDAAVFFVQNHDQIGNRALGERISVLIDGDKLRLAMAILLLNPHIPLLFMGEEFAATSPFLFFCDWKGEQAQATVEGRRKEFEHFPSFATPEMQEKIPDPNAVKTFEDSRIKWQALAQPHHAEFLEFTRELIRLRHEHIVPMIQEVFCQAQTEILKSSSGEEIGINVLWQTCANSQLRIMANFSDEEISMPAPIQGKLIWNSHENGHPDILHPQHIVVLKL